MQAISLPVAPLTPWGLPGMAAIFTGSLLADRVQRLPKATGAPDARQQARPFAACQAKADGAFGRDNRTLGGAYRLDGDYESFYHLNVGVHVVFRRRGGRRFGAKEIAHGPFPCSRTILARDGWPVGCQEDFPVIGGAGVDGVLTRSALLSAIHGKGLAVPVSRVMDVNFLAVGERTWLDEAYRQMHADGKTVAAVLERDRLLGMLSLEGISRYLMLQTALREARAGGSRPSAG